MKILLDNGHGEETPGKCSPEWPDGSRLREYEFGTSCAGSSIGCTPGASWPRLSSPSAGMCRCT